MTTAITTYESRFIVIYRDLFTDSFLVYSGKEKDYQAFAKACKTDKIIMLEWELLNTHYIMRGQLLTAEKDLVLLHISMQELWIRQRLRALYKAGSVKTIEDVQKIVDPKRVTVAEALRGK